MLIKFYIKISIKQVLMCHHVLKAIINIYIRDMKIL